MRWTPPPGAGHRRRAIAQDEIHAGNFGRGLNHGAGLDNVANFKQLPDIRACWRIGPRP